MIEQVPLPFLDFLPVMLGICGVLMVVLRGGVSRVFFDIVGTFQANRLIHDAEAGALAMQALFVDAFAGIAEAAGAINDQIQEMEDNLIPVAREVERARLEFEKFFDDTVRQSGQLAAIKADVIDLGREFGFVADEALKAGSRVAQLSAMLGPEVVEPLTRGGLALGAIGEMDAADAQKDFMSLMQQNALITGELTTAQFNLLTPLEQRAIVTKNVADTLNTLNSVEDRSVARMPEIIEAMNHFGGVARLAGEDVAFMAAMTATLIERGITAESTGMALRFVYARLSGNISGAADALRELGVETTNTDGTLRSLEEILNELAPIYNQLEDSQKPVIAQAMAGNRHFSRLMLLLQDMERTNQLAAEGFGQTAAVMTETGEATGFLATMFEDTAFQINQTEADIANLRAEIGERMLPATLAATQAQADMLQGFVNLQLAFEDSFVGDFVSSMIEARQILATVFMPYATALLNLQALQIAMGTFHIVLRAINGEQIAFMKQQFMGTELQLQKNKSELAQQALKNHKAKILNMEERINLVIKDRIAAKIKMQIKLGDVQINQKKIANLEELKTGQINDERLITQNQINDLEAENLALQGFIKQEKGAQLFLLDQQLLKSGHLASLQRQLPRIQEMSNVELREFILLQQEAIKKQTELGMAAQGTTHQMSGVANAGNAISMAAMLAAGAIMLFQDNLNKIPFVHFENGADAMMASIFLMTLSFVPLLGGIVMSAGALGVMAIKYIQAAVAGSILAAKNGIVATATGAATLAMGIYNGTITFSIGAALKAAGAYVVLAATNIGNGIAAMFAAGGFAALSAAMKSTFVAAVGLAMLSVAGVILVILASQAVKAAKKLMDVNASLDEFNENMTNTESFGFDESDYAIDTSFLDNYTSSLNSANQAQESFNNAREELFFGFKAGNVQGALVKQIQQQGVETFIANTEIIQTNNFNGMTTDDMAKTVLDAIEREAGARGMNLSNLSIS
jgi:TP901 family phage tail tape measure protein